MKLAQMSQVRARTQDLVRAMFNAQFLKEVGNDV